MEKKTISKTYMIFGKDDLLEAKKYIGDDVFFGFTEEDIDYEESGILSRITTDERDGDFLYCDDRDIEFNFFAIEVI